MTASDFIFTINAGSSSIKFSFYEMSNKETCKGKGEIKRIGLKNPQFTFREEGGTVAEEKTISASDLHEAADCLFQWLEKQALFKKVKAIGHRVVFGMKYTETARITKKLVSYLQQLGTIDPDHLPGEVALIKIFVEKYPELTQAVCFDTTFHQTLPRLAFMLPLPRRYEKMGIRGYGFHGLSYAYLIKKLKEVAGREAAERKVILAHLGNGASMAAVKGGKSMDTSMGFTPAGGFMMGTRPGNLDPGVIHYILKKEGKSLQQLNDLMNHQSGLLGVSGSSSDMHDLLEKENTDEKAAEAVALFCYQVKKWIGAYSAVLDGLEILVFSGGIGENASEIRKRICKEMGYLGIQIDTEKNQKNEQLISTKKSKVAVYVIPTNEELMIAKQVKALMNKN